MALLHSPSLHIILPRLYLTLLDSIHYSIPRLFFTLYNSTAFWSSTIPLLDSTLLYPGHYFTLLDPTAFHHSSTSSLLYHVRLYFPLLHSTLLWQGSTWHYITLTGLFFTLYITLLPSMMAPVHSTWLYCPYHGSTLHYSNMVLLYCNWIYITLPWLYFTLLNSTASAMAVFHFTWLYITALLHFTWLSFALTWLYCTLYITLPLLYLTCIIPYQRTDRLLKTWNGAE